LAIWAKESGWLDDPPTQGELDALWKRIRDLEAENERVIAEYHKSK